jgi:hypothetical protein
MAWPFGKKQEESNAGGGDQTKTEVDALVDRLTQSFEAKLEEKFKPISTEVTALKNKWESIESAASDEVKNKNEETLTEEQKAAREKNALLALNINTNARLTESEVLGELSGKWGEFIPEIRKRLQTVSIDRKAQPNYAEVVRSVANLVIGEAAVAKGLNFDGQRKEFFLEDAAGKTSGESYDFLGSDLNWTDPRSGRTMTPREQLAKLGISPEEFAKSQKAGVV